MIFLLAEFARDKAPIRIVIFLTFLGTFFEDDFWGKRDTLQGRVLNSQIFHEKGGSKTSDSTRSQWDLGYLSLSDLNPPCEKVVFYG